MILDDFRKGKKTQIKQTESFVPQDYGVTK